MLTALTLTLSIALHAPAAPVVIQEVVVREDPWKELRQTVETARAAESKPYPLLQALSTWTPTDLRMAALAAAREGGEPEVQEQNLTLCLEYYSVVSKGPEDAYALLMTIENQNLPLGLRVFLLRRLLPGRVAPSLFNSWWLEQTSGPKLRPQVLKSLTGMATQSADDPNLLLLAMDTLFELRYRDLVQAIQKEALYLQYFAQQGLEPSPQALLAPGAPKLTGQRKSAMDRRLGEFGESAAAIATQLKARNAAVREKARTLVERVVSEVPLSNSEDLRKALAEAAQ